MSRQSRYVWRVPGGQWSEPHYHASHVRAEAMQHAAGREWELGRVRATREVPVVEVTESYPAIVEYVTSRNGKRWRRGRESDGGRFTSRADAAMASPGPVSWSAIVSPITAADLIIPSPDALRLLLFSTGLSGDTHKAIREQIHKTRLIELWQRIRAVVDEWSADHSIDIPGRRIHSAVRHDWAQD